MFAFTSVSVAKEGVHICWLLVFKESMSYAAYRCSPIQSKVYNCNGYRGSVVVNGASQNGCAVKTVKPSRQQISAQIIGQPLAGVGVHLFNRASSCRGRAWRERGVVPRNSNESLERTAREAPAFLPANRVWNLQRRLRGKDYTGKHERLRIRAVAQLRASVSGGEDVVAMQEPNLATQPQEGSIYRPFLDFAVQELTRRPDFSPLCLKEDFGNMTAKNGPATADNVAFTSSKIRVFRMASIQAGSSTQILNVAGFARPEFDLPIFCADFVSVLNKNIIVLDLNSLYNTSSDKDYKERYYNRLMPLANKYTELLPWGDKLTTESLQFFSPLVLWTKAQREDLTRYLYPAFQDYLLAWLNLVDSACPATDAVVIAKNQDAQQRYLSWRSTKDPGWPLLAKLYGEQIAESYVKEFLFSGQSTSKSFLDFFPEYTDANGGIYKKRSMIGKSFEKRPWNKDGDFFPQ